MWQTTVSSDITYARHDTKQTKEYVHVIEPNHTEAVLDCLLYKKVFS